MKTVSLKITRMENAPVGASDVLNYKQYLDVIMRQPQDPRAGLDITEMEKSMRVLNVLKDADGTLTLEDADFEFMVGKIKAAKFNAVDQALLDFVHDLSTPL